MTRNRDGDLSLATSFPGALVRCVRVPDVSPWHTYAKLQIIRLPKVGERYTIRFNISDVNAPTVWKSGILLREIVNPGISLPGYAGGEPFFPFVCFTPLGRP